MFSMPREDETRICNMNDTEFYLKSAIKLRDKITSCECLEPCHNIKYSVEFVKNTDFDYESRPTIVDMRKQYNKNG